MSQNLNNYASTSATAVAVGPNGSTNPSLQVDASTSSAATGVKVKSAAAAAGVAISTISSGTNENLTIDAKGSGTVTINGTATGSILHGAATSVSSSSASALAVGPNGAANPVLQVDGSTSSAATGVKVKGAAAAGGVAISVVSSGTNENLTIDAKGSGTVTINGTATGAVLSGAPVTVTAANANALSVGPNGTTNPTLDVDTSTASAATGLKVKSAAAASGLALSVVSSGTNENLTLDAKGSGTITLGGTSTGYVISGQLLRLPSADNLTAHAGGGQGSALALTAEVNRVTTVATAGDSVSLPASAAGLDVVVINAGANPMQVYGAGTDTINGVATGTGVSQMPSSVVIYVCATAGAWSAEGISSGFSGSLQTFSYANNLTAHAGGGQASALALTALVNNVATVATAGDSVALPVSAAGLEITVVNSSTKSMQVFGAGTDTINGVATATGVAQMANSVVTYFSTAAGTWIALGLGSGYAGNFPTTSYTDAITAHAGGGRASAVAITTELSRVTTVGTAADSVVLPAAVAGMQLTIINAAASNAMQVFASGSDTIDGTAGATGYSQAAGKTVTYFTTAAGSWHKMISA